jgi:hypothetical protein
VGQKSKVIFVPHSLLASGKTLVELAMEKVYNGKEFEKKKG